jgi:HK97 family phage prohead protease
LAKKKEIRSVPVKVEVRENGQNGHIVSGYALAFNQPSNDLGFIETIDPHALDEVDLSNVFCLYNHDWANVLARTDTKTLLLRVDKKGLHFDCTIPHTTLGSDVFENVRNGNVQGMSFGFTVAEDQWNTNEEGKDTRLVRKIDQLFEISLTCVPAYADTTVTATRSLEQHKNEVRNQQLEKIKLQLQLAEIAEEALD